MQARDESMPNLRFDTVIDFTMAARFYCRATRNERNYRSRPDAMPQNLLRDTAHLMAVNSAIDKVISRMRPARRELKRQAIKRS